jgi:hypothetical protein
MHDLLLLASLLLWIYISVRFTLPWRQMQRDLGYVLFRRRGSNPPGPGRKPAPPAGPPEPTTSDREEWDMSSKGGSLCFASVILSRLVGGELDEADVHWLAAYLRANSTPPPGRRHGWGPGQPPAPGMRREYLWSPSQMDECGGPCWEAQDPRCCDCGALWRDVPIRMDEGQTQRGNGNGGPTTPRPPIKPQPSGGRQLPNLFP